MVKNILLKNLKDKKTSAQTVMKMYRMIKKVKLEKEKKIQKRKGEKR